MFTTKELRILFRQPTRSSIIWWDRKTINKFHKKKVKLGAKKRTQLSFSQNKFYKLAHINLEPQSKYAKIQIEKIQRNSISKAKIVSFRLILILLKIPKNLILTLCKIYSWMSFRYYSNNLAKLWFIDKYH
jgi:hypothetical protein